MVYMFTSRGKRRKDASRCPVIFTVVLFAGLELLASAQACVYYTFDMQLQSIQVIKSRWTSRYPFHFVQLSQVT